MRKILALMKIGIVILSVLSIFLLIIGFILKGSLERSIKAKEIAFDQQLNKEKTAIRSELSEKIAKDMAAYEAVAKQLESERRQVKELETKLQYPPKKPENAQNNKKVPRTPKGELE